ncbi:MAG: divergent polysaccharide deacetylase family protein [Halioglobus sp.]|nr:divergent polysaccharide deacetylase family protein [Halioglobus sp.]
MKRRSSKIKPATPELLSLTLLTLFLLAFLPAGFEVRAEDIAECAPDPAAKRLVIIIDDMGHSLARGRAALALPGKINFAVIPYTPHGVELAERAHDTGKEVLLHAPMSTVDNDPLSRGGLTSQMDREEFRATFAAALEQVPHVKGVNNHMGSDLTQRRPQMAWLMQELRGRELYFVDSRTSDKTVAATVAAEFSVPNISRSIFLDNDRDTKVIDERFQALLRKADSTGLGVAIGHPYPETIAYLKEELLTVHERGFRPVFVSEVVGGALEERCLANTDASAPTGPDLPNHRHSRESGNPGMRGF